VASVVSVGVVAEVIDTYAHHNGRMAVKGISMN
jgi:hypothetical protein